MPKKNPYKNSTIQNVNDLPLTSDNELEDLSAELFELEQKISGTEKATKKYNYEHVPMEIVKKI